MIELRQRFGKLLAGHRKRAGLTQEALAARAGISPDMISRMEAGATGARFPTIDKLAQALEIDPAELFTPDLPQGAASSSQLRNITARLSTLNEDQLRWLNGVIEAALKPR